MSCCAQGVEGAAEVDTAAAAAPTIEEIRFEARELGDGLRQSDFSVPDMHCGACMTTIEKGLRALPFVEEARANLSSRRVVVKWRDGEGDPGLLVSTLAGLGYPAHLYEAGALEDGDEKFGALIRALAVAGFATANIMLLSVSVWSGATESTRELFHWISALIAAPALAYSGQVFYRSAFSALRVGRLNMDVPISLGVLLAFAMSFYETITHGEEVWFDASVMLLFFLLIGRTLDHVMRERARQAVSGLSRLAPRGAMAIGADGAREYIPVSEITPGQTVMVASGDRVPVDGVVVFGASDLDCALVTGESLPQAVSVGADVRAGTLNLTGPLQIKATASARDSFLAEMISLMEAAEGSKGQYRRIADRASGFYAPVVHLVALSTFIGWLVLTGNFHLSLYTAIAVLIITCPCALGIAVPIVQVVAAGRLFEQGIMVKDGGALERLSEAGTIVFDKTGTLTLGRPRIVHRHITGGEEADSIAASLAAHSQHPLSRAIAEFGAGSGSVSFDTVSDIPGSGVEGLIGETRYRLGRADWALDAPAANSSDAQTSVVFSRDGVQLADYRFEDRLRPGVIETIAALKERGLDLHIVSGDQPAVVSAMGARLGIASAEGGVLPGGKAEYVRALAAAGHKVLMVGDGINDAPALVAAHVSMAPSGAADIGRSAADFVFLRDSLEAVSFALDTSVRSGHLIRQNFGIAILYNIIAVPIAVLGFATPLIAAVAMSSSSIVVVLNALRLKTAHRPYAAEDARSLSAPLPAE